MTGATEVEIGDPRALGQFALALDDGFRVVFRRADGTGPLAAFWIASALVVAITLSALLQEPEFSPVAWGLAALMDFAAIYVFHALRKGLSKGGLIVDGAERRVFLPQGAEMSFDDLREVVVVLDGAKGELILVHGTGAIAFGPRPLDEVRIAAAAVARVGEIPSREEGAAVS